MNIKTKMRFPVVVALLLSVCSIANAFNLERTDEPKYNIIIGPYKETMEVTRFNLNNLLTNLSR